jgi:Domain of unknown function (DUF4189)
MQPIGRRRQMSARILIAAAALAGLTLGPRTGAAEGALAVGEPPDVAAEGFAYGFALNAASSEDARAAALRDCRHEATGVDKRAQARCTVVQAFRNSCVAVAMDPKDATPGVGWAVAGDKETASRQALAKCVATAGDDRRDARQVTQSGGDGNAK